MPFLSSKNIPLWVFALSFASLAGAQSAADGDVNGPDRPREGGKVSVTVSSKADHSGSDAPGVGVMPSLEYQWANGWYAGTNRGVGYNFSRDPALQYGLGLGLDLGRKESGTGALAGMGSMDPKVEYGVFLRYVPDRNWRLSSVLRYGSGDTGQGATGNFGANYAMDIAPQWRLDWGVATTWANSQSMQSNFGVNAAQSQQSGHSVYSPTSGLRDVSSSLNLSYQVAPKISLSSGLKATSLIGDARNSPIVTSPQTVSGSLSVGYTF
jgi:outer membrane scaffolding protein for murein synthesis (MipA/OmpV family)